MSALSSVCYFIFSYYFTLSSCIINNRHIQLFVGKLIVVLEKNVFIVGDMPEEYALFEVIHVMLEVIFV